MGGQTLNRIGTAFKGNRRKEVAIFRGNRTGIPANHSREVKLNW